MNEYPDIAYGHRGGARPEEESHPYRGSAVLGEGEGVASGLVVTSEADFVC